MTLTKFHRKKFSNKESKSIRKYVEFICSSQYYTYKLSHTKTSQGCYKNCGYKNLYQNVTKLNSSIHKKNNRSQSRGLYLRGRNMLQI